MKTRKLMALILITASIFIFSGIASARNMGFGNGGEGVENSNQGQRMQRHKGPLGMIMKFQCENIMASVIADITGESVDTITTALQEQKMKELLDSYNVDRDTIKSAVDAVAGELVTKYVELGLITQEQADEVTAKIAETQDMIEDL